MPIDAAELRRLHEGGLDAVVGAILVKHIPEILAALSDRDRLDWLETSGMTQLTLGWESFEAAREDRKPIWIVGKAGDDEPFKGHAQTIRAAVDAARGGK